MSFRCRVNEIQFNHFTHYKDLAFRMWKATRVLQNECTFCIAEICIIMSLAPHLKTV